MVTGWEALCQLLSPAFTRPTAVTSLHIVTGWVLCRSKPTVTSLVCTIGRTLLGHAAKHWTVYERFFYRAAWSLPEVSRLLLVRVVAPLIESFGLERVIDLNIDDTTCGRCGRHVAFAGYFKDASLALLVQTLVKTWYLRRGVQAKSAQPRGTDWAAPKGHPSYLDMLATLRKALWAHRININSTRPGRVRELLKTLAFPLCAAA